MAHLTGLLLIDAPASALNNAGAIMGERTDNKVAVKQIIRGTKSFPYVSAQSFRYWLRTSIENSEDIEWNKAPIYREAKIAYTDSNPLKWWDDDLFGYMRAESKRKGAKKEDDPTRNAETPTTTTITRVSPFRVSTLVSIAPSRIIDDFGVMARHEGDPVPHEHQFYVATLKGLLSLDLRSVGTFWASHKTGFKNLDETRIQEAEEMGLIKDIVDGLEAYRLSYSERGNRISSLVKGLSSLEGGAKQAIHYTDVTPSFIIFAVTKGGNHIFHHVIDADRDGKAILNMEALQETLIVYSDQLISPIFIGLPKGYIINNQREELMELLQKLKEEHLIPDYYIDHPRMISMKLAEMFRDEANYRWLD